MKGIGADRMFLSIKYGRPGTAMKPFGEILSDQEIGSLVSFITRVFVEKRGVNTVYHSEENGWKDFSERYPEAVRYYREGRGRDLLPPELEKGKRIFQAACVTCHLAGPEPPGRQSPFRKWATPP
jgi:mono/diheme cytochrome c family protein